MRDAIILAVVLLLLSAPVTVPELRAADSFLEASPDRRLEFPEDHASQPEYRTEWWYFTGVLNAKETGKRFGYQVTVFRNRLTPRDPSIKHPWVTNQVFLAHLAISVPGSGRHRHTHRLIRGHPGLAEADTSVPGRVRVGDWTVSWGDTWTIRAKGTGYGVDLTLKPEGPPLLHGRDGYSRKGPSPGQASHYFSYPRMETRGQLNTDGETYTVEGTTWFDREFFSSQLSPEQVGWDWFGVRLSDGSDVMVFRLRERDGSISPTSSLTLRRPDGTVETMTLEEDHFTVRRRWTSEETGARYPVEWGLAVPELDLSLTVESEFDDQELTFERPVSPTYWEGMVRVSGEHDDREVSGAGYLELTGYDEPVGGSLLGGEGN